MNNLSWFLYLSDLVNNLQVLFGIAAGVAGIVAFVSIMGWVVEDWSPGLGVSVKFACGCFFAIFICASMPSKSTMYAIAISQFGEQIVSTDDIRGVAGDAKKALRQWMKKQIDPSKE